MSDSPEVTPGSEGGDTPDPAPPWTVYRATPGQMALGLFTLRASDGLALSRREASVRWLVIIAPSVTAATAGTLVYAASAILELTPIIVSQLVLNLLGLTVPLGWYVVVAYTVAHDPRGQGIHDRAAGSVVVRREGSPN